MMTQTRIDYSGYTITSVDPDAPTMGIGGFEMDGNTGTGSYHWQL